MPREPKPVKTPIRSVLVVRRRIVVEHNGPLGDDAIRRAALSDAHQAMIVSDTTTRRVYPGSPRPDPPS